MKRSLFFSITRKIKLCAKYSIEILRKETPQSPHPKKRNYISIDENKPYWGTSKRKEKEKTHHQKYHPRGERKEKRKAPPI